MAVKYFNISVQNYYQSKNVPRLPGVFAYRFTNLGDVDASVNGMIIYARPAVGEIGDSREVSCPPGNSDMFYAGNITLKFDANSAGADKNVEIVQMYYMDVEKSKK